MMKTAIELIDEERKRQIDEEGYNPYDDRFNNPDGELARAAACYAIPKKWRLRVHNLTELWPWALEWWKPTPEDRERELVKAAALIVAEIDRLREARGGNNG